MMSLLQAEPGLPVCWMRCNLSPKAFLLFFAKDLVANDAARLNSTIDQAAREPTDSVGWVVATCRQPSAQGGYQFGAAFSVRWIEPLIRSMIPNDASTPKSQIAFLEAAAEALNDEFLGFNLAEEFDCRHLGLLYYVMASCDTLGGALKRASRYIRITNEAIELQYREAVEPMLRLAYSGIPRHADRHQIEFCNVAMVRVSRLLCGRQPLPIRVSLMHVRSKEFRSLLASSGRTSNFVVKPTR